MRILHILDHSLPFQSGYALRTRALLVEQHRRGWETIQITSAKQPPHGASATNYEIAYQRTPPLSTWIKGLPVLGQLATISSLERQLRRLVVEQRPDLLHAHSPALNGIAALRVAQSFDLPLVYECRALWEDAAVANGVGREGGLRYRLTRALENRVFRRADAVVAICQGLRSEIVGRGIAADQVTVVPNSIDLESFRGPRQPDIELANRLGKDGPVLGYIGSFHDYEGVSLLLEAMPRLLQAQPRLTLLLLGGGSQKELLEGLRQKLDLERQVVLADRVEPDEICRYYDLLDLAIFPRLSSRLTEMVTPLKPLEAMARRVPVLATDIGGHHELVRDGETGILFPAGDREALAKAVLNALDRRDHWPNLSAAAREFVESERSWRKSGERYQAIYQKLLGATQGYRPNSASSR